MVAADILHEHAPLNVDWKRFPPFSCLHLHEQPWWDVLLAALQHCLFVWLYFAGSSGPAIKLFCTSFAGCGGTLNIVSVCPGFLLIGPKDSDL